MVYTRRPQRQNQPKMIISLQSGVSTTGVS